MFTTLLVFGGAAAVIVIAGSYLTQYTDQIADRTSIGKTIAGVVLLAFATSLPEMTIGANAAMMGAVDITAGDLLGSCLFNLLILAVVDLIHRSRARLFSRSAARHALGGAACIVLASVVTICLLLRPQWSVLGRVGLESFAILIAYGLCLRLLYLQQKTADKNGDSTGGNESANESLRWPIVGYLLTAAAIFVAAPYLARSADELAERTGLGGTFVGTTLVALATSLPEVVTTYAAVRHGAPDMAIGNIFGSNAFNLVIFAVVDLFQAGPLFSALSATHTVTAVWVSLITAAVVISQLYGAEKRYWLIEPDASLVIVLVIAALATVYAIG